MHLVRVRVRVRVGVGARVRANLPCTKPCASTARGSGMPTARRMAGQMTQWNLVRGTVRGRR